MFGLGIGLSILLALCILCVCVFEFINGFHDTANAVATVIYTKSLKPMHAVVLSGILNGIGVFVGGIAVAMGIINMLPVETLVDQNVWHSIGMVAAILLTAIFWNLGTWYLGIPASSSHTLIGSILGVGIAYSLLPGTGDAAVNWHKVQDIGLSLLCSPLFGFALAMVLMFLLRTLFGKNESLFESPDGDTPPPWWIRSILVATCAAVSFSHGSNDGQKGIGLMMLILIGIVPAYFALNPQQDLGKLPAAVAELEAAARSAQVPNEDEAAQHALENLRRSVAQLTDMAGPSGDFAALQESDRFDVRREILLIRSAAKKLTSQVTDEATISRLKRASEDLGTYTDFAPWWVVVAIALSLGIGTMIGWKRIVVTIGEKIGKTHLSYAQGASAELVAASTIAFSTYLGLPVSTTHVLSSGIAGTMFARGGKDNLQQSTITKILLAWILTLPVCLTMAGTLFILFRRISG